MKIGSDPEFKIVKDDEEYPACLVIEDKQNKKHIGLDGNDNIGEIRPTPKDCPISHWERIKTIISKELPRVIGEGYQIRAGATGGFSYVGVGGHIHFDNPNGLEITPQIDVLDIFLAIPVLLIEQYPYSKYRRTGSYGHIHAYRLQPHGFEYRTPSSWIVDPFISKSILCLAYAIILDINHLIKKVSTLDYSFIDTIRINFDRINREYLLKLIPMIECRVKALTKYKEFKHEIDLIFDMIKLNRVWDEKVDIIHKWIEYDSIVKELEKNRIEFIINNYPIFSECQQLNTNNTEPSILYDLNEDLQLSTINEQSYQIHNTNSQTNSENYTIAVARGYLTIPGYIYRSSYFRE